MSGRLCCYTVSNYNILSYWLSIRSLFKVSAIRFNTRTKTRALPPDCRINNALMRSSQAVRHHTVKAVGPTRSRGNVYAKKITNKVLPFWRYIGAGGPVIMPHRVFF